VEIPPGTGFVGINSMVRHSVAGNAYGNVRIGAFMGKKIINEIRARTGRAALNYLTEISSAGIPVRIQAEIPETMLGSDFSRNTKRTTTR
jgi:galactokinase